MNADYIIDPRREIQHIGRGDSFAHALTQYRFQNTFDKNVFVEIGTTRGGFGGGPKGDGWASLAWAWYVNKYGGEFYTVDVDNNCLEQCKLITQGYKNVYYHNCSGAEFLECFDKQIDFLYLDGSDDPNEMVEEYDIARFLLSDYSIILLDDIPKDYLNNGKGQLVIPNLLEDGWKIVYHDTTPGVCQMCFSKQYGRSE